MSTALEYGVPTNRCGLQLRMGIEKGFFRDEGIDLRLKVVFGGPEIATQFDAGDLPIGELGTPPGLTALARGARFKIVGSSVRRGAVQFFVVKRDITAWRDLRGARLGALSRGSCSDWYLRALLAHHGIDAEREASIVGLGRRYPEILQLIAQGELDGAVISEPHVSMGEEAGLFDVWLSIAALDFVPRMQWSVVVANESLLAERPDLVAGVLRGCRRSYRYADTHRDEWAEFGAGYFGISRETMLRSIERELEHLHLDCEVDLEGLEAAVALQRKLGTVTTAMRLNEIVHPGFVPVGADA